MVEASDHVAAAIVYAAMIKANPEKFKAPIDWDHAANDIHTLATYLNSKRPAKKNE